MEERKKQELCREFILIMQASLDETAAPDEEEALKSHMEHCESCSNLYRDLAALKKAVSAVAAEPPSDIRDKIVRRITEENRKASIERVQKRKNRRRIITFAVGAAALLTLAFVGVDKLGFLNAGNRQEDGAAMQASMDEKGVKTSAAEPGLAGDTYAMDIPALESADRMEPDMEMEMEPESAMESDIKAENVRSAGFGDGYGFNREDILAEVYGILTEVRAGGSFGEVIYAMVSELPSVAPLYGDADERVGIYAVSDYADFVTSNSIVVTGWQYELTKEEIEKSVLEYGGNRILLVLENDG